MRRFALRGRSAILATAWVAIVACNGGSAPLTEPIVRAIPIEETRRDVIAPTDASPTYGATPEPVDPAYAGRVMTWSTTATHRIAGLRHLAVNRPIPRQVVSRTQMLQRIRQSTVERFPPGVFALSGEVARHLGLIPTSMDLEEMETGFEEESNCFYDPIHHSIVIGGWEDSRRTQPLIEVTAVRALQFQNFDLDRYARWEPGTGDRHAAMVAIGIGDGIVTALEDIFQQHGVTLRMVPEARIREFFDNVVPESLRLRNAPYAMRESARTEMREGLATALRAWRARQFAGLDALMRNPPVSTEQIFHSDKLASREAPIDVPAHVPPSLAAQYTLAYHDVEGELGLRMFLGGVLGDAQAAAGASGWGGDRSMLLLPTAQRPASGAWPAASFPSGILVWAIVFDGPAQASRFEGMARRVLARRFPGVRGNSSGNSVVYASTNGRAGVIAHSGRTVVIVDNAPSATAASIANEAIRGAAH